MSNGFDLTEIQNQMWIESAKQEIRATNAVSERFGLTLNESEIKELVEYRETALKDSGRVEFGGGILPKLIAAFCDSPYIEQKTFESTMAELQEAFYYFKSESMDKLTDDELIDYMVKAFNGRASGSSEYLIGKSLEYLCRCIRSNETPKENDGEDDDNDDDEEGDL